MIVICYLYNKNGMASWCTDAAKALQYSGQDVLLVKSKNIELPKDFEIKYIDFEDEEINFSDRTLFKRVSGKISKYTQLLPLVPWKDNFLILLHSHLLNKGYRPKHYLLNQSSLVNPLVNVPQHLIAWTYKPHLKDYLRKAFLLSESFNKLQSGLYNAFFWHKVDWCGYKNATSVMAVSQKLTNLLLKSGVNASTVYPGTDSGTGGTELKDQNQIIKFAVMALHIDDKRKGLKRIIETLKRLKPYHFQLTLIGMLQNDFKEWVLEDDFPAVFTGLLNRDKAVEVLNNCDMLLFGSLVDDWGFVQVEAMSRGLAVLSPNASPFDEIIGRSDYLYDQVSETDLENKLMNIISTGNITKDREWFKKRYDSMFSLNEFGKKLIQTINVT